MSINVNWPQSGAHSGRHFQTQNYGRHVLLDTASLTAVGLPPDGTEKFATLAYVVNPSTIDLSGSSISIDTAIAIKDANSGVTASIDATKGLHVDITQPHVRQDSPGAVAAFTFLSATGLLETITGTVGITGVVYLQIFDSASVPSNGAVPVLSIYITGPASFSLDYHLQGFPFVNGLSMALSSTFGTLTKIATAGLIASATYRT